MTGKDGYLTGAADRLIQLKETDYSWLETTESSLNASVCSNDTRAIALDRTLFHPLSLMLMHRQAADHGELITESQSYAVHKTFASSPWHLHILDELDDRKNVRGQVVVKIDKERRAEISRAHSAMDLTSMLARAYLGVKTLEHPSMGRHAASDRFGLVLSSEFLPRNDMPVLQEILHEWVANDVPIRIRLLPATEVLEMDISNAQALRDRLTLPHLIPVVSIDELDQVACDGTHVATTREIGHVQLDFGHEYPLGGVKLCAWPGLEKARRLLIKTKG